SFIADHAMDWLKSRDSEQPFYLHLGFVQPHVPLMDDPIWAAHYADADIELPDMTMLEATNEVWGKKVEMLKEHSQIQTMTDDFVREGIRHYLGAVSLMDQKIGEVIDTLDQLGELDNTWIIYGADHGEMLGEHHLWAKHCFYEGAVQVPLIISSPDRADRGVCSDLTQLIDVVSTIADIGQVDPPDGARGKSLLPTLEDGSGGYEYVFSTIQDWTGVRNENYRFTLDIPTGTPCELYDLEKDPGELNNCVDDSGYADVVKLLTEVVQNHRAG
ncbi:MAG: sulfatase-like hydrolase/transferase, partial [Candidatus Latescibacteria bacterium]|nr:sulfatase-like hydrolase/transferase [Candidatus Latescibacterota bacterium]